MHITLNYLGVRSLALRTMNHERLWISWFLYHENRDEPNFTPELVNSLERVFPISKTELLRMPISIPGLPRSISFVNPFKMETLSTFRDPLTGEAIGYVTLGSRLSPGLILLGAIALYSRHRGYKYGVQGRRPLLSILRRDGSLCYLGILGESSRYAPFSYLSTLGSQEQHSGHSSFTRLVIQ